MIITNPAENEPEITVDNLEVAQFIYLLLNNQKICQVIDTITSKVVLILGRFTDDRNASRSYAMFEDYWKYDWVLPIYRYEGLEPLLATLAEKVIAPAEGKLKALEGRRRTQNGTTLRDKVNRV